MMIAMQQCLKTGAANQADNTQRIINRIRSETSPHAFDFQRGLRSD
jgi:hypothetical protein